jgi:hypothetical protein
LGGEDAARAPCQKKKSAWDFIRTAALVICLQVRKRSSQDGVNGTLKKRCGETYTTLLKRTKISSGMLRKIIKIKERFFEP